MKQLALYHKCPGKYRGCLGWHVSRHKVCYFCRQHMSAYKKANRKEMIAINRNYYANNKSEFLGKMRQYNASINGRRARRAYLQSPSGKENSRASSQRRLARKMSLPNTLTKDQWTSLLISFDYKCAYCDQPAEQQDHIVPVNKGGGYVLSNILPTCESCNKSKQDKNLREWLNDEQKLESIYMTLGDIEYQEQTQ